MIDPMLTSDFFTRNRDRFRQQMQENSVAVIHGTVPVIHSADQFHRYRQSSNFFYLTGIEQPGVVLYLYPENSHGNIETLFIPRPDNQREIWEGKMLTKDEAKAISGVENIQYLSDFEGAFVREQQYSTTLYLDYDDAGFQHPVSKDQSFAAKVRSRLPGLNIEKAGIILADLRRIKSDQEIQLIRKAIDITASGLNEGWKSLQAGMKEYEFEAVLTHEFIRRNAREFAFEPIVASGVNGATLHYIENQKTMEAGELLLTDVGARYSFYNADITRTVPVDDKFTDRQADIYNAVLDVQNTIMAAVKPGARLKDLSAMAKNLIGEHLIDLGLIENKEDTVKYYMHSVGHHLGIDTHDIADPRKPLETGCVITIEPGIYIQEEQLGIRIEDNVLVTGDGCENLSVDIPKTLHDVEALFNN